MEKIIYFNGKKIKEEKAHIPILSDAFLSGLAVYETLRTYGGKFFCLKEHLKRLAYSADQINLHPKWKMNEIEKQIHEINISSHKEVKIKILLTSINLIFIVEELIEKSGAFYQEGVKLIPYFGERNLPEVKKIGDLTPYLARQEAEKKEAYEAILVDRNNRVRECAAANLFWVKKGQLFTTDKQILKGITRDIVIQLSGTCQFDEIKYEELCKAEEVFITQTSTGIIPVTQIGNHKIGLKSPGIVTQALMEKFEILARGEKK